MQIKTKRKIKVMSTILTVITSGVLYLYYRVKTGIILAADIQTLEDDFYFVEYKGDYGFDRFVTQGGASSDREVAEFAAKDLFKGLLYPRFLSKSFGCSTLVAKNQNGGYLYGRNFDWMQCKTMVVKSRPLKGYTSVSTVNMNFLDIGVKYDPRKVLSKILSMVSLYAPVDGVNERGLCVAVLMIDDGAVTAQNRGKPGLTTTTAVRLLLDRAADVEEAIRLLNQFDMHSSAGMMLHFALSDPTGRSVAVEYVNNQMVVTESPVVTNFYLAEGEKHGIGAEQAHTRYAILMERLLKCPVMNMEDVKEAMSSVDIRHFREFASTEWTIVYNQDSREIRYYHRGNYEKYDSFDCF